MYVPSMLWYFFFQNDVLNVLLFSLCRRKKKEYALKIIDKTKTKGKEKMIENEVSILRRVKHPNIILLIEEFDTPSELYLVMELVKVRLVAMGICKFVFFWQVFKHFNSNHCEMVY